MACVHYQEKDDPSLGWSIDILCGNVTTTIHDEHLIPRFIKFVVSRAALEKVEIVGVVATPETVQLFKCLRFFPNRVVRQDDGSLKFSIQDKLPRDGENQPLLHIVRQEEHKPDKRLGTSQSSSGRRSSLRVVQGSTRGNGEGTSSQGTVSPRNQSWSDDEYNTSQSESGLPQMPERRGSESSSNGVPQKV